MKIDSLLGHCAEIVKIVSKSTLAPDELISQYFRGKKYIGSKERKIISEIVFMHLRLMGFSNFIFDTLSIKETPSKVKNSVELIALSLYVILLLYPQQLNTIVDSIEKLYKCSNGLEYLQIIIIDKIQPNFNMTKLKVFLDEIEKKCKVFDYTLLPNEDNFLGILWARYSIPSFILKSWFNFYPSIGINPIDIAESLLFPSNFTIRLNNKNFTRDEIIQRLETENISCIKTKYSPFGITITERINLLQNPLYKNGTIEVQDEGSQLICLACNPNRNDKILDACAGAGGKSLFFAFLQNDSGYIVANDINILKLKELRHRANRSGFKSIHTHLLQPNAKPNKLLKENYFDIVLVDAPCSGIGTSRRNPMHKWLLTPKKLEKIVRKQVELLEYYSRFVKKDGTLVYATCSLMPEENQYVTQKFLEKNSNFQPEPLSLTFDKQGIALPLLKENFHEITLLPHIHGTDGFYIAKFRKATNYVNFFSH